MHDPTRGVLRGRRGKDVRIQVHKGGLRLTKLGHASSNQVTKDLRPSARRLDMVRKREIAAGKRWLRLLTQAAAEASAIQPGNVLNQPAEPVTSPAFVPTNRWRGYVASIDGNSAVIRLSTEDADDEHELRVPVGEVAVLGGHALEPAMPVMLTQGRETRAGRPRRTITLEARPLVAWTADEAAEIEDEARERALLLRDDT
jgi:hypothetical protein